MSSRESSGLRTHALVGLAVLLSAAPANAQWLDYKTPGIPRTADGKPNLAAPTPRTAAGRPDFSGVWRTDFEKPPDAKPPEAAENLLQPWAEAMAKETHGRSAPGQSRNCSSLRWDRPLMRVWVRWCKLPPCY